MNPMFRCGALLGALSVVGIADAATLSEVEPNNSVDTAQVVDISKGAVTLNGVLGNGAMPDVDFYRFSGHEGDVITIDIDGGMVSGDPTTDRDVDTVIAIFDVSDSLKMIATNNDAPDLDPGSTWASDSRLDLVQLPHTGDYIVGVTSDPRSFRDGAGVLKNTAPFDAGQYTLIITPPAPPAPPVMQVKIDIVPGRFDIVPLSQRFEGEVPVALLSSKDFDATKVDIASITFGATGDEQSLRHCERWRRDTNRDRMTDLVCHFKTNATGFEVGDTQGVMRGKMADGRKFEGHGSLKVIAEKRRHLRHPHIHWLPPYHNDHDDRH